MTRIHAIQTGTVHVKSDFLRGSAAAGSTAAFFVGVFTDRQRVDLPIYCWVIEHNEGVFVIDTGELSATQSHFITQSTYSVRPQEEVAAQLAQLGIQTHDVSKVILTHAHGDHIDGMSAFPGVPVYMGDQEYAFYKSGFGGTLTRRTSQLPRWFDPKPLVASGKPFGTFDNSYPLTKAGDVVAIPTPGHTAGHISVIALVEDVNYFIAGDLSYDERALLDQTLQGPTMDLANHPGSLARALEFAQSRPTVYLPSHDWESGKRLQNKQVVPAHHAEALAVRV